jgi:hypothetical protein
MVPSHHAAAIPPRFFSRAFFIRVDAFFIRV